MVSSVEKTTSLVEKGEDTSFREGTPLATSSISSKCDDPNFSDPDLLIREYFLSSPIQRTKLRNFVSRNIKSWNSVLAILTWSKRREISSAYDAASDLLAEFTDINLLKDAAQYLRASSILRSASTYNLSALDDVWDTLIKGVAYAHQISAQERFNLLLDLFSVSNRRVVKASLIDALVTLADEIETESIRQVLGRFTSIHESDSYIRDYAEQALQEIE